MKNTIKNIHMFFQSISGAEAVGLLLLIALGILMLYGAIFLIIRMIAGLIAFLTI